MGESREALEFENRSVISASDYDGTEGICLVKVCDELDGAVPRFLVDLFKRIDKYDNAALG